MWVGRYAYAYPDTSYEIGKTEAMQIHDAGLGLVLLCSTANGNGFNGVGGWLYNNGYSDGTNTANKMKKLGVPTNSGVAAYCRRQRQHRLVRMQQYPCPC